VCYKYICNYHAKHSRIGKRPDKTDNKGFFCLAEKLAGTACCKNGTKDACFCAVFATKRMAKIEIRALSTGIDIFSHFFKRIGMAKLRDFLLLSMKNRTIYYEFS
jgi:hypothetical protein